MKKRLRINNRERGQVLVLALIALLALIIAIFLLLDISNVIRAKVKAQNAVDAAAITGANWQKHTLNLVGELNLVKATTILISDSIFGADNLDFQVNSNDEIEQKRENELIKLKTASDTLSQIQQRALFIVPLIGFGAAQQTAKNNGINYNEQYGEAVKKQILYVDNPENLNRKNILHQYMTPEYITTYMFGYNWKTPYLSTIYSILLDNGGDTPKGIATLPNAQLLGAPRVKTEPPSSNDFADFLQSYRTYEGVQANYWCWIKDLLRMDYSAPNWWGNLVLNEDSRFRQESEYLPVNVEIRQAQQRTWKDLKEDPVIENILSTKPYNAELLMNHYDVYDPRFNSRGDLIKNNDTDQKLSLLPALTWAYYGYKWEHYDSRQQSFWETYLISPFKKHALYYSGAVSRMDIEVKTVTVSGTLGVNGTRDKKLAKIFKDELGENSLLLQAAGNNRLDNAQNRLQNSAHKIYAYSLAKPYGSLSINDELKPPHESAIVLPVFTTTALIPVAMENPGRNMLANYLWYEFIVNYLPMLGTLNSLDDIPQDMQEKYSYWHNILKKLNDPEWREEGITWLETPLWQPDPEKPDEIIPTNEDTCTKPPCNCNGQCNHTRSPSILH